MSARGTITSSAVVSRRRSTLAISARSCRSSSGCRRRAVAVRLGRLLHQFGDRLAHAVLGARAAAAGRAAGRSSRCAGRGPSRSCALPRIGHAAAGAGCAPPPSPCAAPRRDGGGRGPAGAARHARPDARGGAPGGGRPPRPRAAPRRAPGPSRRLAGRAARRSARWSACCAPRCRAFRRFTVRSSASTMLPAMPARARRARGDALRPAARIAAMPRPPR